MQLEKFLDKYNSFTLEEEKCTHYLLTYQNDEQPWGTYPAPLEAEELREALKEIAENFPPGRHGFRVVALSSAKAILGQIIVAQEGRSTVKGNPNSPGGQEALLHSRAMAASVATQEQQLNNAMARGDMIAERELQAQQRLTETQSEIHELVQAVNRMMIAQESRDADIDIKRAQAEAVRNMAAQFTPLLGPLVFFSGKLLEKWLESKGINLNDIKAAE